MRRRLRFTREARTDRRIVRELGWQDLDRDRSVEAEIARAVDDGHSAASDLAIQPVVGANRGDDAIMEKFSHDPRGTPRGRVHWPR